LQKEHFKKYSGILFAIQKISCGSSIHQHRLTLECSAPKLLGPFFQRQTRAPKLCHARPLKHTKTGGHSNPRRPSYAASCPCFTLFPAEWLIDISWVDWAYYTCSVPYCRLFPAEWLIDISWVDWAYKISTCDVTYCRHSATIYIMVVKFRITIFPPPPQLSLHRSAALAGNSNGTSYVTERTQKAVYIVRCLWSDCRDSCPKFLQRLTHGMGLGVYIIVFDTVVWFCHRAFSIWMWYFKEAIQQIYSILYSTV
jgi:hypothetical protein